jgi:cytochrome c oxidase subunit II
MRTLRHPRSHAVVRAVAAALVAGAAVAACGSNGSPEIALSPAGEVGREIANGSGCAACHGSNGEGRTGPPFVGLYGSTVEFSDSEPTVADDDYLYEAITDPRARQVAGYGFPMPSNDLTDAEVEQVIAYIRDLAEPAEDAAP